MSAFIVSEDTMHHVVTVVKKRHKSHRHSFTHFAGVFLEEQDAADQIGALLYQMNRRAVLARYPGDEEYAAIPEPYRYRWLETNPCQRYASLSCLLYQCSEGDVPEESLFAALEALQHWLAHHIVTALPDSERATWG